MQIVSNAIIYIIHALLGQTLSSAQVTVLASMFISLFGSVVLRLVMKPLRTPLTLQLTYILALGIYVFHFTWGWVWLVPLGEALATYLMMRYLSPEISHIAVFWFSMLCLSVLNIQFVMAEMGSHLEEYNPDHIGTVMVLTQRLSSLSFNIRDGILIRRGEKVSEFRRRYAIYSVPSLLEYFAYMFSFFGIITGPLVFYKDFITSLTADEKEQQPSYPFGPVLLKTLAGVGFLGLYVLGSDVYPYTKNINAEWMTNNSLIARFSYLYISMFVCRTKYYGTWIMGDAIFNAAGIGYNGKSSSGKALWDGNSNINVLAIEFASGLKDYIDNWNIMTAKWVRLACYERLPHKYRLPASFLLSATWHGFFPGYYLMFFLFSFCTSIQRMWRKKFRPMFVTTDANKQLYDVVTTVVTQTCVAYNVFPFMILEFGQSMVFYTSLSFAGHFIVFGLYLILSMIPSPAAAGKLTDNKTIVSDDAVISRKDNFSQGLKTMNNSVVRQR